MVSIKHRYTGVEYKTVTRFSVKFKDVFILEDLYVLMYEWLVERGFATRVDADFPERYYLDRTGPAGKEVWIRWRPKRHPIPGNKFWRFDLDIDMHVLGLKDVELVVQNKKVKANKGEVEVQVAANLIYDASGEWKKSALLKPFRNFYFKRFLSKKKDMIEKELYNEAYEFRDAINYYLQLETYLPSKMAGFEFWPKRTPEQ
ncbi:hypothetical protein GF343_00665 [Candidatus Woesearchaeota archaeon]|nr:hypothetical protein [Candidatus Woesearchaeota archaeon]